MADILSKEQEAVCVERMLQLDKKLKALHAAGVDRDFVMGHLWSTSKNDPKMTILTLFWDVNFRESKTYIFEVDDPEVCKGEIAAAFKDVAETLTAIQG